MLGIEIGSVPAGWGISASWSGAGKVCGFVGIAGALVLRHLGIGAQRPSHDHLLVGVIFCGDHLLRGNTLFYPIDQGIKYSVLRSVGGGDSQLPKCGWAGSTDAMFHAGHHVKLQKSTGLGFTHRFLTLW